VAVVDPTPKPSTTISVNVELVKWLIGGLIGVVLTLVGFAFWLGSLQANIAKIQQIEDQNSKQETKLSSLDGNQIAFAGRLLKVEGQGSTSSAPPKAPAGSVSSIPGLDSNVERTVVEGDLRVRANVWGTSETAWDSGRGNDVRCPEGQFVVGVRAVDTDGGGYCVECISVVRVFCRSL
jgi:hypothetical protein